MNNQQSVTSVHALLYALAIVASTMLGALGLQLASGTVPIPAQWDWVIPVLIAGITSVTMLLPRVTNFTPADPAPEPPAPLQLVPRRVGPVSTVPASAAVATATAAVAPPAAEPAYVTR